VSAGLVELAVAAAVISLGIALWNARRYPEKACWKCDGDSWFKTVTPFLGWRVRGACRRCGGRGWKQRRLSRLFGWGADLHRW
jgi:hypothetical protein